MALNRLQGVFHIELDTRLSRPSKTGFDYLETLPGSDYEVNRRNIVVTTTDAVVVCPPTPITTLNAKKL